MNCDEIAELLDGYVDDELPPDQRAAVEAHLAGCGACRTQCDDLAGLKEDLAMITFREPTDAELDRYWQRVYNRLERGIGWLLLSIGAVVLLCYVAYLLIENVIQNPAVALTLKIGLSALIVGAVVLFVSILRERLSVRKADRYSKEIQR